MSVDNKGEFDEDLIYCDLVTYAINFLNCSAFSTIVIPISYRTKVPEQIH